MNKLIIILISVFISVQLLGQNSVIRGENSFELSNNTTQGFNFTLKTNDLNIEVIKAEGIYFARLTSENFIPSNEEGAPEILIFNKLFEIPADADIQLSVIRKKEIIVDVKTASNNSLLYPHQLSPAKTDHGETPFIMNKELYKVDKFYELPVVQATYLGQMRSSRIARLTISPFSYNPVSQKIKIITELQVEVRFINGDISKTITEKQNYFSNAFQFVSGEMLNSGVFAFVPPVAMQAAGKMVIIADSAFGATLKPFVDMKERQGFDVNLVFTQNPQVGNTLTSIKSFLQNLYNTPATSPDYAILVGDVAQIPSHAGMPSTFHFTDLPYFEYTNDDFPEIFYGRFSCEDTIELHNIIAKTLEYEQYLMPDPNYLDTSVLIAGYDNSYGPTHGNGQLNYGHNYYYNSAQGIQALTYPYPGSAGSAAQIRADASKGAAMLNYSAHGNYNGWENPSFKNSDVVNMTNVHKYPVMIGNACLTGTLNQNDCFGEVLTNAAEKGAVGYIGASDNTYWDEDYYWAVGYSAVSANPTYAASGQGFFDGIFHTHGESYPLWSLSLSQIMTKGNLAVTQSGSSRIKYYWEVYHCFGDPSLVHYTKKPTPMTPSYNHLLPIGASGFMVTNSAPYALVALSENDSLVASAYADSLGEALLNFNPFTQNTQALLTITAQDKEPHTSNIDVYFPNGPYINFMNFSINDSAGNNNQRADNDENLFINLILNNLTNNASGLLTFKISTMDTSIILLDSIGTVLNFSGLDTMELLNIFEMKVNYLVNDEKNVKFNLVITDTASGVWNSQFTIKLFGPEFQLIDMTMNDSGLGNGDGIADPGETIILKVKLKNTGSNAFGKIYSVMTPITTVLSGGSIQDSVHYLKADSVVEMSFSYVVNAAAKTGAYCPLSFVANSNGYSISSTYFIVVGNVDEDFETGNFNKFDWKTPVKPWSVISDVKHLGNYSASSATIGNDDTTALEISLNVLVKDSISFYYKVSTESGYDYLKFYIDNLPMDQWSGLKTWARAAYPVSPGLHQFRWEYSKDYFGTGGLDKVWIDDINFPLTDVLSSLGQQATSDETITFYPNPATDFINIIYKAVSYKNLKVSVADVNGRIVKQWTVSSAGENSGSQLVNISDLNKGIYFIRIENNENTTVSKFIKL